MLEVRAPAAARVRIDGAIASPGPVISSAVAPGLHEVRIDEGDHESKHIVEVRAGKLARLPSPPP